jgi:hypothetical protein
VANLLIYTNTSTELSNSSLYPITSADNRSSIPTQQYGCGCHDIRHIYTSAYVRIWAYDVHIFANIYVTSTLSVSLTKHTIATPKPILSHIYAFTRHLHLGVHHHHLEPFLDVPSAQLSYDRSVYIPLFTASNRYSYLCFPMIWSRSLELSLFPAVEFPTYRFLRCHYPE